MTIKENLTAEMKAAMREKDKTRLGTIRLIQAAVKQIEVDERVEVDDARLLTVLDKMLKQRKDSISQYVAANRQDLADVEITEVEIIKTFMPQQLSETEVDEAVASAISAIDASTIRDMGKVMAHLRPLLMGKVDFAVVGDKVKSALN